MLSYPQTDVFLICFTVSNEYTLQKVTNYWVPEVLASGDGAPFIIVGLRTDLRYYFLKNLLIILFCFIVNFIILELKKTCKNNLKKEI